MIFGESVWKIVFNGDTYTGNTFMAPDFNKESLVDFTSINQINSVKSKGVYQEFSIQIHDFDEDAYNNYMLLDGQEVVFYPFQDNSFNFVCIVTEISIKFHNNQNTQAYLDMKLISKDLVDMTIIERLELLTDSGKVQADLLTTEITDFDLRV